MADRIIRTMTDLSAKTGHKCPKASRSFLQDVLGIKWKKGRPAVSEALVDRRMEAYNNGTLEKILKNIKA